MGKYSKLIGAIVGNLVAIVLAYIATNWPAIATCNLVDGVEACTILGTISQAEMTAWMMALFNSAFVYAFPANKPAGT